MTSARVVKTRRKHVSVVVLETCSWFYDIVSGQMFNEMRITMLQTAFKEVFANLQTRD